MATKENWLVLDSKGNSNNLEVIQKLLLVALIEFAQKNSSKYYQIKQILASLKEEIHPELLDEAVEDSVEELLAYMYPYGY